MSLPEKIERIRADFEGLNLDKIRQRFPNFLQNISALEAIQNYEYRSKKLALSSLLHRSALVYWPTDKSGVFSNERLEFLGDAFLSIYVAMEAMVAHPDLQEGQLSKLRAAIVGTENLSTKADELGIGKILLFGKGEMQTTGAKKKNALADGFESVTAALLLDGGDEVARRWLGQVFSGDLLTARDTIAHFDAKTQFQQWVQSIIGSPPVYRVVGTISTHLETEFIVAGFIGDVEIARAKGSNKRDASKAVAAQMQLMVESAELNADLIKSYFERKS
jgi:ribonuclease-3